MRIYDSQTRAIAMATLKYRLEQLEKTFLTRRLREVQDVAELTNVELALEVLEGGFASFSSDPSLAAIICAEKWLDDESLPDPMERYAAFLLRTVIWGGDHHWMTGAIEGAMPMLAEHYRDRFPKRVFTVATTAPPWRDEPRVSN
jgi:hypothetical protein